MVSRSGVRRSAIAGVAVGAVFALVAGLRDRLAATHDANPFAPHNDPHASGRLAHDAWERRAFAAERGTVSTNLPVPRATTSSSSERPKSPKTRRRPKTRRPKTRRRRPSASTTWTPRPPWT